MRKTLLLSFVVAGGLALWPLLQSGAQESAGESADTYEQLKLFGEVFERVRADYVDEVTDEEMVEAAIRGMLSELDPHSSYMDAQQWQDMQEETRGAFGGLGIQVTMEEGYVKVISPIDDTPAAKAGIQSGDLIVQIDGESVLGLTLEEAVEKLRGPVDSEVTVTVQRGQQEPFDVTLQRAIITVESVRFAVEGDIGYIRITQFTEQTTPGLEKAFAKIQEQLGDRVAGYVLDLRNNPGGLLSEAVSVADAFLEQGEIVSTRGRHEADDTRFNATPGDLAKGKPVVVLINGGSASASEIVAGALQDHRRALLLGTLSFGKGSVQTLVPLEGHGAMRMTTARYYTPSGRSIQAKGIAPDVEVPLARIEVIDTQGERHEGDLRGSLANPDEPAAPDAAETEPAAPAETTEPAAPAEGTVETPLTPDEQLKAAMKQDYQLQRAFDLLRGLSLFPQQAEGN